MDKKKIDELVGTMIAATIDARGLTRAEVARRTGIDKSAITRILKGEQSASASHVFAIAEVLGVSPGELIDGSGPPRETPQQSGPDEARILLTERSDDITGREARIVEAASRSAHSPGSVGWWLDLIAVIRDEFAPRSGPTHQGGKK